MKYLFHSLISLLLLSSCNSIESDLGFVSIEGQKFLDTKGRQIILHGVNLVNKDPKVNYLGDETIEDFAKMRQWGFNCVRLGIIWSGLEPEPGFYNEQYLQGIDKRIRWAKENNLYVILDMHQDLYSVLFSDGAPEWATITDGHIFEKGQTVWSDAYFTSSAVQTAWDHFWANTSASDGVGIQDHYAKAWQHVANRYYAETTVVGYDLMNEPFLGSEAMQIFPAMLSKGAELLSQIPGIGTPSVEELAYKWTTHEGRFEILQILSDISLYKQVVDAAFPIYNLFEKNKLMGMYNRVAQAIRSVDKNHILFLETTMGSNMGLYTGIEPVLDENGNRDLLQAYAPHGYDLVTDTKFVASPNFDRIQFIFNRHNETTQRLNMPTLVGEWGAYGNHVNTLAAAQNVVQQFETNHFGDTYWDFSKGMEKLDHFKGICRPIPLHVAGELMSYSHNPNERTFECKWEEDDKINYPTLIYIPSWMSLSEDNIHIEPAAMYKIVPITKGSNNLIIELPSLKETIVRNVAISY